MCHNDGIVVRRVTSTSQDDLFSREELARDQGVIAVDEHQRPETGRWLSADASVRHCGRSQWRETLQKVNSNVGSKSVARRQTHTQRTEEHPQSFVVVRAVAVGRAPR